MQYRYIFTLKKREKLTPGEPPKKPLIRFRDHSYKKTDWSVILTVSLSGSSLESYA